MLRQDVLFAERTFSEKFDIIETKKVTEMYSFISKRKTIDEQCLYTDGVLGAYKGPGMGLLTMPIAKGTYDNVEVEPSRKRFHTGNDQRVLQNAWQRQRVDRVAQCGRIWTNQVLNNKQIKDFIASTVLPHHRTLINSAGGINWSNNQPEKRPTHQRFQRQVENFLPACVPYANELTNQAQAQFIPQTTNVAQRETISNHAEGMVPSFPRGYYNPQATEEKVISIPQGISEQEEEEIIIVMEGTPNDIFRNSQGISVTQGMQEKMTYFPQGIRVPQQTQDNIICIPQGFSMDKGSQENGFFIPQDTLQQEKYVPQKISEQQRILDDIICIPQGIDYPHRMQSESICSVQGLRSSISHGTQGNFLKGKQKEIISVSQGISIPQGTLEEISFAPQGINFPLGKQGQYKTAFDLSNGLDCQGPHTWGTLIQGVTTNDVSDLNKPGSTNLLSQPGLISHIATTQPEVHIEQNLKGSSDSVQSQQTQLKNINVESSSLSSIAERSRAIAAEVFSDAAQNVGQVNIDKKSRLEVHPDHKHETQTSATRQPSRKRKRTISADIENKIKQSPIKRQKVNREAADMTCQIESESEPGKKVCSKNIVDHEEFMEDAIKILQGQSADIFPESVIDQLFKDTFESDIFLTSSDDFAVDPLMFFNSEFGQDFDSL